MAQVSGNALVLLIQLLNDKIAALEKLVEQTAEDAEELVDYEEELLSCTTVERELQSAYEKALNSAGNLPPYRDLTPHRAASTR